MEWREWFYVGMVVIIWIGLGLDIKMNRATMKAQREISEDIGKQVDRYVEARKGER